MQKRQSRSAWWWVVSSLGLHGHFLLFQDILPSESRLTSLLWLPRTAHTMWLAPCCMFLSYITRKYSSQSSFWRQTTSVGQRLFPCGHLPAFFSSAMSFCHSYVTSLLQRLLQTVLLESWCSLGPYPLCWGLRCSSLSPSLWGWRRWPTPTENWHISLTLRGPLRVQRAQMRQQMMVLGGSKKKKKMSTTCSARLREDKNAQELVQKVARNE